MVSTAVTARNLGESMFSAARTALGARATTVRHFLKHESEKLAITLRMVIQGLADGEISRAEARILLNQQRLATTAVLTSAEGMTAVAVQSAINSALGVVKDFVNRRVGFTLL